MDIESVWHDKHAHRAGEGKSSNEGIGYKSYLGMLLFTKSMKNIAYRSMDVQEATVRMTVRMKALGWTMQSVSLVQM